jgi:hypothetical protein
MSEPLTGERIMVQRVQDSAAGSLHVKVNSKNLPQNEDVPGFEFAKNVASCELIFLALWK